MGILDKVKGAVKALPKKLDEPAKVKMTVYEVKYVGNNKVLRKRFKSLEEAEEFSRKVELEGKRVISLRKLDIERTIRGLKKKDVIKKKALKAGQKALKGATKTVNKIAENAEKGAKKSRGKSRKKELPSLLGGTPNISGSSPLKKKKKGVNLPKLI